MTEFVLVSCSKSKHDGVHRAADLYQPSRIFRKRREFAQERGDHWGVLSAKHGYLRPWDTVEEYERHITDRTEIWAAFVIQDILRDLEDLDIDTVTVLAGRKYVEPLVTELEAAGYEVIDYNSGLRPGERYSKLKSDLQPGEQQKLVPDGGYERPEHENKQPRRWSDWSEIQRWREEGKGRYHAAYQRRLKINRLRAEEGISKQQAQRRLEHDDVEVPDHVVDGRPEALTP